MPLTVEIQNERGYREGEVWWHPRSSALLVDEHSGTCCLRFIDPYGDTTFNQSQLPVLIEELRDLRDRVTEPEAVEVLSGLLGFLQCAVDQVHMYVKFIGD
jgi:hypothetical protein